MWSRGGIRSSALERAKAQLSGQGAKNNRILKEDQRGDVASIVKSLQSGQMSLHGLSDLSSDAESDRQDFSKPVEQFSIGGGSKYLKRSVTRQSSHGDRSAVNIISQRGSQSVALSRLALIEDRIRNRTSGKLGSGTRADLKSGLSVQSSSELSEANGSRFLKKNAGPKESERPQIGNYVASAQSVSHIQNDASVDSDEEDMRRLLGESHESPNEVKPRRQAEKPPQQAVQAYRKSSKEIVMTAPEYEESMLQSAVKPHHKSPSPSPPSAQKVSSPSRPFSERADLSSSLFMASDHSEIRSLEELFPITSNHDDTQSERSLQSDDFKLNVMTLDDLVPDPLDVAGLTKEKSDMHPREQQYKPDDDPVCYESDFESEIQTETAQSSDEISEHLSNGNEHSLVASEPRALSANSNRDDYTLSDKPSKSTGIRYSKSESSLHNIGRSDSQSDSSDGTQTYTSPQGPSVRRIMKDATVQTQAEGLTFIGSSDHVMLGPSVDMSYMDPTPLASHVISSEALEALTAYSPAVLALNDILRQQLTLTKNFIQSSRHLHKAMLESLGPADYRYTTLEDTKEFIRSNRPPKLTMEEAVEEVLQEMRDYHYI